jgi:Leucine-rich repeat (LRR) protein
MSLPQPNQTPTFSSFADYCLHKDSLGEEARYTVKVLLKIAGPSDCNEADRRLSNLITLELYDNKITDISVLSTLTNLTELYLDNNKITDISVLSTLTNLTELKLNNNKITDISILSILTNLTELELNNNQITDINGLSTLTNLTKLYLHDNKITDISVLSTLTNLTRLSLSNIQITDISGLSTLTNLTELYLYDNKITDISGLSTLTNLTELDLCGNKITDISGLSTLTNLTYLYLDNNQITDLSPLQSLSNLNYASIYGVRLPKKYFLHQHEWLSQWVLEEENAEIRRLLIQVIGYDRICQELEATELDSWQEYSLLKIDIFDDFDEEDNDFPVHLLKMTCPSTGHIHALRVPSDINSARAAIRWVNWGIDPEEFAVQT